MAVRGAAALAAVALLVPAAARAQTPLADSVRAELAALPAEASLYAEHLPSGRTIAVHADRPMDTMSTIKLAILVAAFRDAETGRLDLDARATVEPGALRRGSGVLRTLGPGLRPTYRGLLTQMIQSSDNTATDMLIRRLGRGRVNAMLDSLGYRQTRLRLTTGELFREAIETGDAAAASLSDHQVYLRGIPSDSGAAERLRAMEADSTRWLGRTTAREMARLLTQIYRGELTTKADAREMVRILAGQSYDTGLPSEIGDIVTIAHKTGGWGPYGDADVGLLLYPGGPTVVAIYVSQNRGRLHEVDATMGRIAAQLYRHWK